MPSIIEEDRLII